MLLLNGLEEKAVEVICATNNVDLKAVEAEWRAARKAHFSVTSKVHQRNYRNWLALKVALRDKSLPQPQEGSRLQDKTIIQYQIFYWTKRSQFLALTSQTLLVFLVLISKHWSAWPQITTFPIMQFSGFLSFQPLRYTLTTQTLPLWFVKQSLCYRL